MKISPPYLGLLIAIIIFIADQATKWGTFHVLLQRDIPFIEVTSFFNLVVVHNTGVSFGMLNDLAYGKWILSGITLAIVTLLLHWLFKSKHGMIATALGLVIGGAIGNLVDRIRVGYVADFLDFHIANYHWPAFNLADSAICIGIVLLLLEEWLIKKDEKNEAT